MEVHELSCETCDDDFECIYCNESFFNNTTAGTWIVKDDWEISVKVIGKENRALKSPPMHARREYLFSVLAFICITGILANLSIIIIILRLVKLLL